VARNATPRRITALLGKPAVAPYAVNRNGDKEKISLGATSTYVLNAAFHFHKRL
jgi:hypothetical protein